MNLPLCCTNCIHYYYSYRSGTGKQKHICQIRGVGTDIEKLSSCPLGHECITTEEKEHDLTDSVLSLYNK